MSLECLRVFLRIKEIISWKSFGGQLTLILWKRLEIKNDAPYDVDIIDPEVECTLSLVMAQS